MQQGVADPGEQAKEDHRCRLTQPTRTDGEHNQCHRQHRRYSGQWRDCDFQATVLAGHGTTPAEDKFAPNGDASLAAVGAGKGCHGFLLWLM